ncbi:MAG TPA: hypothetical protein VHE30_05510 [Polyangiaceae bacterium]|nr:hypothetical protein [Polyangiaceae bacterium]
MAVAPGTEDAVVAWARRRIALAATATVAGIATSLILDQTVGAWLTTAAFAFLLHALHRFGRSGPA